MININSEMLVSSLFVLGFDSMMVCCLHILWGNYH